MSNWKKFSCNIQNIKHETEKAFLIAMPHSSEFDGFEFWISKKLVREGSNSYEVLVSVTDDMTFKLKRVSDKTRKVLAEQTIDSEAMIDAFGGERVGVKKYQPKPFETITRHPEPLTPECVEPDTDLIR